MIMPTRDNSEKKINIKAVFLFGPESNLPSFFFCFERSQPCGGVPLSDRPSGKQHLC